MGDQSVWKKEISFRRKPKDPKASPEESAERSTPDESTPEEPTSIWKKELSFGRKRKEAAAPEPIAEEPQPVAEAVSHILTPDPEPVPTEIPEEEQVWTKEVSFSRKIEHEPVAEGPVAEEPVAQEPVADEPAIADEPAVVQEPVVAEDPVVDEPVVAEEPVVEEPAVTEEPLVGDEQIAPTEAVVAEEPTETWSAKPSLPPEPEFAGPALPVPMQTFPGPALPVAMDAPAAVVHPPVPAAELPPLPGEAKKTPFWKKDISFGGSKKSAKEPKAERAAKEPKQPKQKKQKEPKIKVDRGSKGSKRLVGLKIGASQLAAARVSNNGSAELLQLAREPLESGIVVGGELRDPDALAEALKGFFAKHKLPKKGVRLGIANNRIGVRTFDIAGIHDEKQLTNAIRFRAQEALPIPIDEAVLDHQILSEGVDDEGQPTKRVLLVVAYRELIDRYMDACKKAGIGLVGIDLEAFALLRALQAPQEGVGADPSAALVAVSIGHERSTFAVSDGRVCEFTRVLEWGGSALNVAIARALDAAPSEVEGVKRALALTDEMVPDGLTSEQAKKARDAMRRAIQTFARELVSSLQYYQNQPGSLGIGEIALTGGTAHLPGLAGELERLIGVRVRVGDPLARMKVSKRVGDQEQIGSLAVAIGLGIED